MPSLAISRNALNMLALEMELAMLIPPEQVLLNATLFADLKPQIVLVMSYTPSPPSPPFLFVDSEEKTSLQKKINVFSFVCPTSQPVSQPIHNSITSFLQTKRTIVRRQVKLLFKTLAILPPPLTCIFDCIVWKRIEQSRAQQKTTPENEEIFYKKLLKFNKSATKKFLIKMRK